MLRLELRASQNLENKRLYLFLYQYSLRLESDQVKAHFLLH